MNENTSGFRIDSSKALDIVLEPDPILREEMPRYDFVDPVMGPEDLTHALAQTCHKHKALGLSAPQIGIRARALIVRSEPMICMFNPKIVATSEDVNLQEEGCLSVPGLILKIKRFDVIRVRFTRPNGETVTERFEGMTARIIQHEIDHLNGVLFTDRVSKLKLNMAKKKLTKK